MWFALQAHRTERYFLIKYSKLQVAVIQKRLILLQDYRVSIVLFQNSEMTLSYFHKINKWSQIFQSPFHAERCTGPSWLWTFQTDDSLQLTKKEKGARKDHNQKNKQE